MAVVLQYLNYMFGFIFIGELVLKVLVQRTRFFCQMWNIFDTFVVLLWILDAFVASANTFVNPLMVRLARLCRVLRLMSLARNLNGLDSLLLLVTSIAGSGQILFWALMVLCTMMMLMAMMFTFLLMDSIEDQSLPLEHRRELFKYFGSFTQAMLTMFELTLGNWVVVTRLVGRVVSEWWCLVFLVYKCTIGFAVITVIRGVFMRETFKVAANDDDLMILEKGVASRKFKTKMREFVNRADESGEGKLDHDEFIAILTEPDTRTWLAAMDLDVRDPEALFNLLDDGDHIIDADELCAGVSRMKGPARSLDIVLLQKDITFLMQEVQSLSQKMQCSLDSHGQLGEELQVLSGKLASPRVPGAAPEMLKQPLGAPSPDALQSSRSARNILSDRSLRVARGRRREGPCSPREKPQNARHCDGSASAPAQPGHLSRWRPSWNRFPSFDRRPMYGSEMPYDYVHNSPRVQAEVHHYNGYSSPAVQAELAAGYQSRSAPDLHMEPDRRDIWLGL